MRLSAFDTYCLFLALKNHFTRDSYDFFKYRGKVNASADSFMSRRDRFQFQKLSRLHSEDDMRDFIVSNIVSGKTWVGDFLDDDAEENYLKHLKVKQSLSYTFTNELDCIFTKSSPTRCFKIRKNEYPDLFMMYLSGNLSIETMVVLNNFVNYIPLWDHVYDNDPVWTKHSILLKKYTPFLEYDKMKLKIILKDKIKEYEHGEEQEAIRAPSPERENAA